MASSLPASVSPCAANLRDFDVRAKVIRAVLEFALTISMVRITTIATIFCILSIVLITVKIVFGSMVAQVRFDFAHRIIR